MLVRNANRGDTMEVKSIFEIQLTLTRDGLNQIAVYYGPQRLQLTEEDKQHFESILEDYEQEDRDSFPFEKAGI